VAVGIFSLLGREISMPVIAALLTIVGYSLNDTIVVFDRVREDMQVNRGKGIKFIEILNGAINVTLSRTLLTSLTTLFTVVVLFFFGGEAINDFALVMIIGIVVGTYSSIFVASPVVYMFQKQQINADARRSLRKQKTEQGNKESGGGKERRPKKSGANA